MTIARLNQKVFLFVHVPKTGGSSVTKFLTDNGRVALDGAPTWGWSRCTVEHVHAAVYSRIIPRSFYDEGFLILRDPVDRMRSEFKMYAQEWGPTWNPANWVFEAYAKSRRRPTYSVFLRNRRWTIDIDTWLRLSLAMQRRQPYRGNNHFRGQSEFWIEGLTPFFFDEGLDRVAEWLKRTADLGADAVMPHRMPDQPGKRVATCDFSDASKALIRRHFARDYELIAELRRRRDAGEFPGNPPLDLEKAASLSA
ncbi:sulfotransferase family protein [Palleronia aestuarii]|uniref:Sulfotransferase family protein n=1 Tax=Palleronia aestuarii TaxID=568105 RepID=A0A2W7ND80_9RHOB|nr:sulfotransferase family 2 domain-containing protein [Palleronia aestuarii]PZX18351.1 sulfotransferase family protein [Palleronia aestuarii]